MGKKQMLVLLMVLFISTATVLVSNTAVVRAADSQIQNTLVSQDPDPVEPGGYVDVRFKLENVGSDAAKNVIFELSPEYPFSLEPGVNAQKSLGTIDAGQVGDKAYIILYRLRVDNNAIQGDNEIRPRVSVDNGATWTNLGPYQIRVRSSNPILTIDSVETQPTMVAPGADVIVDIKLKNYASSSFKDLKATLTLVNVVQSASGASITELPFSPTGSTNEKTLLRIDPGETADIRFDLVADPGTASGVYKIPVVMTYTDELGKSFSVENVFSIRVGEQPDYAITLDSSTVYSGGSGKVSVKFINKGSGDLKFVYLQLKKSTDYDITSSDTVYLGNINSDDYATADFELTLKKTTKDKTLLPISAEFRDTNNQKYSEATSLDLSIVNLQQAEQMGLVKGNSSIGILVTVLIVVAGLAGYWFWRRRKKK